MGTKNRFQVILKIKEWQIMTEEQKQLSVPKCGTENSTDDKFCQECGIV